MSFDQTFLSQEANAYLNRLLPLPFPVMERIEQEARQDRQPTVGRQTGSLLRALVQTRRATRVLEVGCNLGYSALWMAAALPENARLDTIEYDAKLAHRARQNFEEAGVAPRIRVHEGAALKLLPELASASYDVIFLDATKAEMPAYLTHALLLARPGCVIAADNVFWQGRVWDDSAQDEDTQGVREYTKRAFSNPRLSSTVVPVEDGLAVSVVLAQP